MEFVQIKIPSNKQYGNKNYDYLRTLSGRAKWTLWTDNNGG